MIRDEAYDELAAYSLGRGDVGFLHQHVVDTYAIQTANDDTKPIAVVQALVGLYLHVEHGLTGRTGAARPQDPGRPPPRVAEDLPAVEPKSDDGS